MEKQKKQIQQEETKIEKFESDLFIDIHSLGDKFYGFYTVEIEEKDFLTIEELNFLNSLLLENQKWFIVNKKYIQKNLIQDYENLLNLDKEIKEVLKKEKLKPKQKMPLPEPKLVKKR